MSDCFTFVNRQVPICDRTRKTMRLSLLLLLLLFALDLFEDIYLFLNVLSDTFLYIFYHNAIRNAYNTHRIQKVLFVVILFNVDNPLRIAKKIKTSLRV